MPRLPAKVTQADISRAIRAAKESGAEEVVVATDGRIHISLKAPLIQPVEPDPEEPPGEPWEMSDPPKRMLKST